MDLTSWLALLKQYGPILGFFLGFVLWQAHQISRLLDRNSSIYEAEIKRLADVQQLLLTHLLGPQPSSNAAPTIKDLKEGLMKKTDGVAKEEGD